MPLPPGQLQATQRATRYKQVVTTPFHSVDAHPPSPLLSRPHRTVTQRPDSGKSRQKQRLQQLHKRLLPQTQISQQELEASRAPAPLVSLDIEDMGFFDPTSKVLALWRKQYHMPKEESSDLTPNMAEIVRRYSPPASDARGIATACAVIGAWALLFHHALFGMELTGPDAASWPHIAAVFFSLEFVYTGLFITTHDAMHGTIAYNNRWLNDAIGWVAISCYAWFDYGMLHRKHWEHHNHTGIPGEDPDFHRGNPNPVVWFARFMWEYSSIMQFIKLGIVGNLLQYMGVPFINELVFMTGAPVLAAIRLFYFGTYLPHKPTSATEIMSWQKSHTSSASPWVSFFTCYHFDFHWEHHRWPYAPWWDLHKCKQISGR